MTDRDPGDEDDGERCPAWRRALIGWWFREGSLRCFYPAVVLPALPDHDPGDEQPCLTLDPEFEALFDDEA